VPKFNKLKMKRKLKAPLNIRGKLKEHWRPRRNKAKLIGHLQDPETTERGAKAALSVLQYRRQMITTWEYTCAMRKLTQVKCWSDSLKLLNQMRAKGFHENPATYSAAVDAYATARRWKDAVALLAEMELHQMIPVRHTFPNALWCLGQGRFWEEAIALFDKLFQVAGPGWHPEEADYQHTIKACEQAQRFDKADRLFRELRTEQKIKEGILIDQAADEERKALPQPPKAAPAPWRVPGAISPYANRPDYSPSMDKRFQKFRRRKVETRDERENYAGGSDIAVWGDSEQGY